MSTVLNNGYRFLYENGAPVLKNEAALNLGLSTAGLRDEMLRQPQVQYWFERLALFMKKPAIHNAADECFENIMHKLLSLGVREDDHPLLSECSHGLIQYMKEHMGDTRFYDTINPAIVCGWLTRMGHTEDIVCRLVLQRIEAVYGFVKEGSYEIYVDTEGYPAIPAARAGHPLVNPALYEGNVWRLPTVHDMFLYARLPQPLQDDSSLPGKIDTLTGYILDGRYQRLHLGYGLMLVKPNKYYGMGWSVHLNGYEESGAPPLWESTVWAMELMSHFPRARKSEWFLSTLAHLNQFGENGVYEFPPEYISEAKNKYYVGGGHMGLGEDRKKKLSRKLESTAWMMRILVQCEKDKAPAPH